MSQTKIKNKTMHSSSEHIPVLLHEVLDSMQPQKGEFYLDLTAGYGGHAGEILKMTQSQAVLVDRDENAVRVLRKKFSGNQGVSIMQNDFLQATRTLAEESRQFDLILADLGVSSPHLDNANRGFSLKSEGPLDMRMDPNQELSAEYVVNNYSEAELTRILREYGEEPKAVRMSRAIIESRPLKTTLQLAEVAKKVWTGYSKVHPATRLFQAVRIEVNNELGQLEAALEQMPKLLKADGRVAIITFHSLEDRIVKRFFRQLAGDRYDAEFIELTSKPLTASAEELVFNPRARSAKIRVYRKRK